MASIWSIQAPSILRVEAAGLKHKWGVITDELCKIIPTL